MKDRLLWEIFVHLVALESVVAVKSRFDRRTV